MSDGSTPSGPSDPASSTPAALGTPGPKRIRSVPTPVRGASLLTISTAGYGEDANWRRGVTLLWILFGLIALAEACHVVFSAFDGYTAAPPVGNLIRVGLLGGVFLTLWFGWNWTRWILVVFAFLFGAGQLVALLRLTDRQLQAGAATASQPLPGNLLYNAPILAGAMLYLLLAGYLAFASDVPAFTKHRREEGRGWVAVPVAFLLGVYVAVLFAIPIVYNVWLHRQQEDAESFGRETLRTISERWDTATLTARCDEELLAYFPAENRQTMMATFMPLGPVQRTIREVSHLSSQFDARRQGFVLQGDYVAQGQFAHGQARFIFNLERSMPGLWRLRMISADRIAIDSPPAPAPAVTPAASPVPPVGG